MEIETYKIGLKEFGTVFLAGFGNDIVKATEALNKTNDVLKSNPKMIPILANEENQKQIIEIRNFIDSGKGDVFSVIKKVKELGSKLKV